jgi:predicted RNA-binding Zn-ribbon protein involved in translation (DUF1610 family)
VGQLQPGRAVEKPGGGYLVYVGVRRFLACRSLLEKYGEPSTYKAFVDSGLSTVDMLLRALEENASAKGERKNLSALEEVRMFHRLDQMISDWKQVGLDATAALKRVRISQEFPEDLLRKLHQMEAIEGFEFKIGHLEGITERASDEKQMVQMAAILAAGKLHPTASNLDFAFKKVESAFSIPWFKDLFPQYASEPLPPAELTADERKYLESVMDDMETETRSPPSKEGGARDAVNERQSQNIPSQKPPGGTSTEVVDIRTAYEVSRLIFIPCPGCGEEIPARLDAKDGEITFYNIAERLEKRTVVPHPVYHVEAECFNCGKEFFVRLSRKEGVTFVDTSEQKDAGELGKRARTGALDFDQTEKRWVRIDDAGTRIPADIG